MPDYIPREEARQSVWFGTFAAGIDTHGLNLGLTAPEIAQAATDAALVALAVNMRTQYESKKQEVTAFKNSVLHGSIRTPMPALPVPPAIGFRYQIALRR